MKKQYGIYSIEEEYNEDGTYKGFRCSVVQSTGKQGKLYKTTDGTEHYREKKDEYEGLEI